jgi:hypothetical protein
MLPCLRRSSCIVGIHAVSAARRRKSRSMVYHAFFILAWNHSPVFLPRRKLQVDAYGRSGCHRKGAGAACRFHVQSNIVRMFQRWPNRSQACLGGPSWSRPQAPGLRRRQRLSTKGIDQDSLSWAAIFVEPAGSGSSPSTKTVDKRDRPRFPLLGGHLCRTRGSAYSTSTKAVDKEDRPKIPLSWAPILVMRTA